MLVLASTALLAACGQSGNPSSAMQIDANASGTAKPGHWSAQGHFGRGGAGMLGMLQGLDLTAAQKQQLQAIAAKFRPAKPSGAPSGKAGQALRDALLAPTVDDATLRTALAAQQQAFASHQPPSRAAMLGAVRAVLTDAQRAKIVAQLQTKPQRPQGTPSFAPGKNPLLTKLNLTADQQAAFDALAAMHANAPKPGADRRAAMVAFWQNGDTSGLAAPQHPAFPVDAFCKFAESLSLDQRKALFDHPGGPLGLGGPRGGFGRGGWGHGHGPQGFGPGKAPQWPGMPASGAVAPHGAWGNGPRAFGKGHWPAPPASGTAQ
ncbi:MAG TPA: Spy/CpxP family protein refolding chaperone [Oscillatoriaceae cyanobacterium]